VSVVFFISGHGFGHASRQVEVINAFAARRPDERLIIRSAVNPDLLARTLRARCELRRGACDTGIVQATSISHDDEATVREAIEFYRAFDDRVAEETEQLANDDVDLVVGDIPPLAFVVASWLHRPSVAVANFTWDWIYETHPGMQAAAPWIVPLIRDAYATATLALELPFSGGFEVFPIVRPVPLIARHPTRDRDDTRRHVGLPLDRPAVLLSFGGYGLPSLDLNAVDCFDRWTVVTTDRIQPVPDAAPTPLVLVKEAAFQSTGFRYEDLVAAVDVVMTKPGFGIIAECMAAGTAMLYTSRGEFREYDRLVSDLPRFVRSQFISQDALFAGRWRDALESVSARPAPDAAMDTTGADAVVDELVRLVQVRT
jgi:hypothetical protein